MRVKKLIGFAFWTAGGAMVPLALDRLVIHPALSQHFGAELFGAFVWVLGIVNLFGNIVANGLSTLLMRDFAKQKSDDAGRMFRTAMTTNVVLSTLLITGTLSISLAFAGDLVREYGRNIYLPLGAMALIRAISLLLITNMRIKQHFPQMFVMGMIEAIILLTVLLVAPKGSILNVGLVYITASAMALCFASLGATELRERARWVDASWMRWFLSGIGASALLNLLNGTQLYLSRIALGFSHDLGEVAAFYAGAAMANFFVVPITVLSSLVLSLLGARVTTGLSRKEQTAYLASALALSAVVTLAADYGGGWLLWNRFPDLAERASSYHAWLAMGSGSLSLLILIRPIVIKFGSLNRAASVAAACFSVQLIALVFLVPKYGGMGAALAQFASCSLGAIAWVFMMFRLPLEAEPSPVH